jgi:hypothetical protein
MSPFGPLNFPDQPHNGVVVNGLPREGGVSNQISNPVELIRSFEGLAFGLSMHQIKNPFG